MDNYLIPKKTEPIFENWYIVRQFLDQDEIIKFKDDMSSLEWNPATTVGETEGYRDSEIKWVPKYNSPKFGWLYKKIWKWAKIANDDLWHFDILGFKDAPQYTKYEFPTGHYDWHMDIMGEGINHRKISLVCPLNSSFEGGQLEFKHGDTEQIIELGLGDAVLFPSFYLHRLTRITSGTRESLVQWISGKPYK